MEDFDSNQDDHDEEDMGIADKMMERGRYMRMLREMERAAEAEADAAEGEVEGSREEDMGRDEVNDEGSLIYSSYLGHQRYYDDLKHINHKAIEYGFGDDDEVKVTIRQDKSLGKGGLCWDAAFCLTEFLLNNRKSWMWGEGAITSMIELGAGTGMVGICLARALEVELERDQEGGGGSARIVTTDLPELMGLVGGNVEGNGGRGEGKVTLEHRALAWGLDEEKEVEEGNKGRPYDVVVGADIVASLYDPELLVETIAKLSGDKTKVFISFKGRESSYHERFEASLNNRFKCVKKIMNPALGTRNGNPGVGLLSISEKKI